MSNVTFNDYYKYYLSRHQDRNCRRMHFLGQMATFIFIICVIISQMWWWFLFTPFVVYPFAVTGHLFDTEPPAFSGNPFNFPLWKRLLYSKLSDLKMVYQMLIGKLEF